MRNRTRRTAGRMRESYSVGPSRKRADVAPSPKRTQLATGATESPAARDVPFLRHIEADAPAGEVEEVGDRLPAFSGPAKATSEPRVVELPSAHFTHGREHAIYAVRIGFGEAWNEDLLDLGRKPQRDAEGAGRARVGGSLEDLDDLLVVQARNHRRDRHSDTTAASAARASLAGGTSATVHRARSFEPWRRRQTERSGRCCWRRGDRDQREDRRRAGRARSSWITPTGFRYSRQTSRQARVSP